MAQSGYGFSRMGPMLQITTSDGTYGVTSGTLLSEGAWHLIAGSYNGATLKLYVNGALVASRPATGTLVKPVSNVQIGSFAGAPLSFSGLMDEVQIHNIALSDAQIQEIYRLDATGLCK
jgi:hypothetical protein